MNMEVNSFLQHCPRFTSFHVGEKSLRYPWSCFIKHQCPYLDSIREYSDNISGTVV